MKNARKTKKVLIMFAAAVCSIVSMGNTAIIDTEQAAADENHQIIYYDDVDADVVFNGQGVQTDASYTVYYDYYTVLEDVSVGSAPSFGNNDGTNICGPVAGANIVIYYDRWYTNLVPNYTPGMVFSDTGLYNYYPNMGLTETNNVITSLYLHMNLLLWGGTTSANFKSGLNGYVTNAGYNLSYYSFYTNSTNVNLATLKTAVQQGKVGLVMCSEYNFVYGLNDVPQDKKMNIVKIKSSSAHMMMVYGYKKIAYYKNGQNIGTDTFLYVSSGFNTSDQGYMELNDYSVINEALIMAIS